jgi:hypothetical protein
MRGVSPIRCFDRLRAPEQAQGGQLVTGLRDHQVALLLGPPDDEVAAPEVHVTLLQGDDLAATEPR